MKEGTCGPKREAAKLARFECFMPLASIEEGAVLRHWFYWHLFNVYYKAHAHCKINYWFSWNFVMNVIRRLFWVESSEK